MKKASTAQQWQALNAKFEALQPRERWMVFAAGLVLIWFILNTLLLDPVTKKLSALRAEITQSQSQLAEIQQQLNVFAQTPVHDINTENREKISSLHASVQTQSTKINSLSHVLLKPENMPSLLKDLLQKNTGLSLVAMQTLAPENILQKDKKETAQTTTSSEMNAPVIYKHGLEITLAGSYLDLLKYAEALEKSSLQVLWSKASLEAKDFPESQLTLRIYSLSLDKTWLSI